MDAASHGSATPPPSADTAAPRRAVFVTTHWSLVLTAAGSDTTQARDALEQLCRAYWFPLYAWVLRQGCAPPDAQDLTQEFFARLLEGKWLAQADPQRGRFRSFLLTALKHFLANEWNKARALKRGGGCTLAPFDADRAEERYAQQADSTLPENLFDRQWALTLLETVVARLEEEYRREGKVEWFTILKDSLTRDRQSVAYAELARQLNTSEGAVRVAVHRLRQRYRKLLRAEVAHTVASPAEVEAEMHYLFQVLMEM
jgi:RNA polymerase sigma-70 factor (ECF subfamily)